MSIRLCGRIVEGPLLTVFNTPMSPRLGVHPTAGEVFNGRDRSWVSDIFNPDHNH